MMNTKINGQKGLTLIWLLVVIFGLITVVGSGKAIREARIRKEMTPGMPSNTSNISPDKTSSQIDQPMTSENEKKKSPPISSKTSKNVSKETEDLLNQIRTQQPIPGESIPSQTGPKYSFDYEDYIYLQEQAQFGHIYEGHPDYQYYQQLQQEFARGEIPFAQSEAPPVYLNPLNDPNINPLANPDINPLMNPDINPLANPNINPLADPALNPGCVPCQFGGQQGFGQYGGYQQWGGYNPGAGWGGWSR